MKSQIEENDIEMYSTHNEGKSGIAERFIRTLKNKSYKYMKNTPNIKKMFLLINYMIQLINMIVIIIAQLK